MATTPSKETIIRRHIKPGAYSRLELKNKIDALYERYGISENAKATDASLVYYLRPASLRRMRDNSTDTFVVPGFYVERSLADYL